MFAFLQPTYPPTYHQKIYSGINSISQNDWRNGPYSTSLKNDPNHNGHVKINLSKMIEWLFLRLFKLEIKKIDFPIKKILSFLVMKVCKMKILRNRKFMGLLHAYFEYNGFINWSIFKAANIL
jgi:hypothetical protein